MNKLNNKGFSLVELMVTFVLVSIISALLFQIIVSTKEMKKKSDIKTNIILSKSNLSKLINDDISTCGKLTGADVGVTNNNELTLSFLFGDDGDEKCNPKKLIVNSNQLTYGDYIATFPETTSIIKNEENYFEQFNDNNFKYFKITLHDKLLDENYSIDILSVNNE